MNALFDQTRITLSAECVTSAVEFGLHFCLSMQESDSEFADCWTHFQVWIDNNGHPNYFYGGTVEDVTYSGPDKTGSLIGVFAVVDGLAVAQEPTK